MRGTIAGCARDSGSPHAREMVPRVAAQAQPDLARVLGLAATAEQRSQQQALILAATAKWTSDTVLIPASDIEPTHARSLHEDARHSFALGRVDEAVNTQLRAFAANPRDPRYRRLPRMAAHSDQSRAAGSRAPASGLRALYQRASAVDPLRRLGHPGYLERADRARCRRHKGVSGRGCAHQQPRSHLSDRARSLRDLRRTSARSGGGDAQSRGCQRQDISLL